jgi:deoxyribodipyrimidine photo-lyase
MQQQISLFWFRRDLRLHDNAGLYHALKSGHQVLPIFIFDKEILDKLDDRADKRVCFIHRIITDLQASLAEKGADFEVWYGHAQEVWPALILKYGQRLAEVHTNHDYEPNAIARDNAVRVLLNQNSTAFYTHKDQVIFEKSEILSNTGTPYSVFTPYSRKWKETLTDYQLKPYPNHAYENNYLKIETSPIPSLKEMGFSALNFEAPSQKFKEEIIKNYSEKRDFPAVNGTSRLSVHLRFGTISIRELATVAKGLNETYLNELIWRDFYFQILWHFPKVGNGQAFRKEYEAIEWRNDPTEFAAWCAGKTGYPIVDAGMRELNQTGFMHNRVRMIVASFLTKHLLIDWRWGEAYFAKKLLDFDLSANNGGWQWASGSGCDAAPYFRVFSPKLQTEKFDPKLEYIKKWIPELNSFDYSQPIVVHEMARNRAIATYQKALKKE